MRTPFEAVALGKAEAPDSVGGPTAGGRLCRLVMKRQRDRIEHVLPITLLPAAILCEIDAEGGKAVSDSDGDLGLLGFPVPGDRCPYALRRVHRERGVLASGEVPRGTRELMQLVEPRHRMTVGLLDHYDVGPVRPQPSAYVLTCGGEPFIFRYAPQAKHSAGHKPATVQDGVPEITKSGIEREDGVRILSHGV